MTALCDYLQQELAEELAHCQELASLILPRVETFPDPQNIDYHEAIEPYIGSVSGDHLAVLNFAQYHLEDKIREAEEAGNLLLAPR